MKPALLNSNIWVTLSFLYGITVLSFLIVTKIPVNSIDVNISNVAEQDYYQLFFRTEEPFSEKKSKVTLAPDSNESRWVCFKDLPLYPEQKQYRIDFGSRNKKINIKAILFKHTIIHTDFLLKEFNHKDILAIITDSNDVIIDKTNSNALSLVFSGSDPYIVIDSTRIEKHFSLTFIEVLKIKTYYLLLFLAPIAVAWLSWFWLRNYKDSDFILFSSERKWRLIVLSSVILLMCVFIRSFWSIIYPGLWHEDVPLYFNYYYNKALDLTSICRKPLGYYNIITELAAWIISFAKIKLLPYLYTAFTLLTAIYACITSANITNFKRKDFIFFSPIIIGLVGLNHSFYYISMTYSIWTLAISYFMLLFSGVPLKKMPFVFFVIWMLLLSWSHPYCVLGIPLAILLLLWNKKIKNRIFLLSMIFSSVIYLLSINTSRSNFDHFFSMGIIKLYHFSLIKDVILLQFVENPPIIISYLVLLGILFLMCKYRDDQEFVKKIIYISCIILLSLIPYFASGRLAYGPYPPIRYFVISQFFWVTLFLVILEKVFREEKIGTAGTACFWGIITSFVIIYNITNYNNFFLQKNLSFHSFAKTVSSFENMEDTLKRKKEFVVLHGKSHSNGHLMSVVIGDNSNGAHQLKKSDFPEHQPESVSQVR